MSSNPRRPQPMHRIRPKTKLPRHLLAMACGTFMAMAGSVSSQQVGTQNYGQREVLTEVILAPMRVNNGPAAVRGWILIYRNTLTGPEVPNVDFQVRNVFQPGIRGPHNSATISWEILRTPNDTCTQAGAGPCPDRIRVLSVPEGFQAIPESAWIDEGAIMSIRVVPTLLG